MDGSKEVEINGETYSVDVVPAAESKVVAEKKKILLEAVDLRSLIDDLDHARASICMAYNGMKTAGPRYTKLRNEIQKLGFDIAELCNESVLTIYKFKTTSAAILSDLVAIYRFLLLNKEDMAMATLSSLSTLAGDMKRAALALHEKFKKQEVEVEKNLKNTQRARGEAAIRIEEKEKEHQQLQIQFQHQQQLLDDAQRLEQEAELLQQIEEKVTGAVRCIKHIIDVVIQAPMFWRNMQEFCRSLVDDTMCIKASWVKMISDSYTKEECMKIWTSTPFKYKTIHFYAGWVALNSFCSDYVEHIKRTQIDLYKYMVENPTYEEPHKNVHELAKIFLTDLKKDADELKQKHLDELEQKHLAAVQQATDRQGTLTHTTVHGVIVGIARSGKDSLMKRLLGEKPTGKSRSTGVAEKAVLVRVEKSSSKSVSACVEDSKWIRLTQYDDEAIEMMLQLTSKQKVEKLTQKETDEQKKNTRAHKLKETETEVLCSNVDLTHSEPPESDSPEFTDDEDIEKYKPMAKQLRMAPLEHKSPIEIFKEALKKRGLQGLRQHLENHWSIYLSNTGGQMEFQELLPLLVSGPSIFFVTFRLDQDLKQHYEIEYEVTFESSAGSHPKIFKYTSNATPLETILQTLASIDAVGTYDYSNQNRVRAVLIYKVFIVGTHRDLLERSLSNTQAVQSRIKEINQILFDSVKSASYFPNIIVLPGDQIIFTVDNFSTSDDDFQRIRSFVEQKVNKGDFAMTSPSHWLIYSLVLRQLKNQIESYSNCYRIAKDCGITSDDELKEALHFIHTKLGIIRYFPIDDLKNIVILDPQVLFEKVTELILETFTSDCTDHQSVRDFNKGIFSFSEFEKISCRRNPDPLLTPKLFARLLEHLRIAAPFHENCVRTKRKVLKYFFPCALSHVDALQKQSTLTDCGYIPPLVVSFECGYRPMGLAGALIKYLMTNERGSKDFEWKLLTEKIYRDQTSFMVKPSCDTVTLKMFPTHIEVTCLPDPGYASHQYCPIEKTCIEVCKTIKAGIEKVNSDINYINNTEPLFTFYCQMCGDCSRFKHHPAELMCFQSNPIKLYCLETEKSHDLPPRHEVWQLQELMTLTGVDDSTRILLNIGTGKSVSAVPATQPSLCQVIQCDSSHHAILFNQLQLHATKWRDIGSNLGFKQGELDNIQGAPKHHNTAPRSWLSAMLAEWLEWAPNDHRGSDQYATLEALKKAVSKADLGRTAESLMIPQCGKGSQLKLSVPCTVNEHDF